MEFTRTNPSARFTVPDKITVRQQLQYFSEARVPGQPLFERFWLGARPLIIDWQCEIMPDKNIDLETITDPDVTQVIIWAGIQVKTHIDSLENIAKN